MFDAQVRSVITQDKSSGRVHERFQQVRTGFDPSDPAHADTRYLVDERCQTDQSGDFIELQMTADEVTEGGLGNIRREYLCLYCFPGARYAR